MLDTLYLLDRTLSHPTLDMNPSTPCGTATGSATAAPSLPSYLQVIQLVEVPTPSPAELGKGSYSSSMSTSSYDTSSYSSSYESSTLSSSSSSMETESESYYSYCSTSLEEEGDMTSGSLDAECDRVRLNRISAWTSQVAKAVSQSVADESDGIRVLNDAPVWCSACDRAFRDQTTLSDHVNSDPCRLAVEYALSNQ